jgi:hypothetical protein
MPPPCAFAECLRDGEPDARTALAPVPAGVGAVEPVELVRQVVLRDALAGVGDAVLDPALDAAAGRSRMPSSTASRRVDGCLWSAHRHVDDPDRFASTLGTSATGPEVVDIPPIVKARRLSARTMRDIRQNLVFAFIYNAAGIPIAAGVLYPVTGLLLSPVIAAAAMALSSVSVISNALRLRTQDLG